MEKIELKPNTCLYPMPVTLVGTQEKEKANFAAIAWVNRANYNPPLVVAAVNNNHFTAKMIEQNKEFSINIPGQDLVAKTDYCGITSGKKEDKSRLFEIFYGKLEYAPMIKECPLTMECSLYKMVELPSNNLYIGEIISAYSEERFLTENKPDIQKIQSFTLTMPDNNYWSVGENIGKAWSVGKKLKQEK
ncbi:MAG: flavin reductase family protein [Candidatus Heimdallarchaeota archaeon]|nr:flavin reductase family protein [Candidatus Heimdallarchaeota archaeon]